jgi:hypothetical protein
MDSPATTIDWPTVQASASYQALSPQDQFAAKQQYFNQVVVAKPEFQQLSPADQQTAQKQFFGGTIQGPSTIQDLQTAQGNASGAAVVGQGLENSAKAVFDSTGKQIGNVVNAVFHPIQTVEGLANAVTHPIQTAKNIGQYVMDRYGNLQKAENTISTDPAGAVLDASTVLGGAGALTGKVGEMANLPNMAKVGQGMTDVAMAPFNAVGKAVAPVASAAGNIISKTLNPDIDAQINATISDLYNKAVAPQVKKASVGEFNQLNNNRAAVIQDIVSKTPDKTMLPTDRVTAFNTVSDNMKPIFQQYNAMKTQATGQGVQIPITPLIQQLKAFTQNQVNLTAFPSAVAEANRLMATFNGVNSITPDMAQDLVKAFNVNLNSYAKNFDPNVGGTVAAQQLANNYLRGSLDNAIAQSPAGPGYAQLKQLYGAYSQVRDELSKAAMKQINTAHKTNINWMDIVSADQLTNGLIHLATGNVPGALANIGAGAVAQGFNIARKMGADQDLAIKNMFSNVSDLMAKKNGGLQNPTGNLTGMNPTGIMPGQPNITPQPVQPFAGKSFASPSAVSPQYNPNAVSTPPAGLNVSPNATTYQVNDMGTASTKSDMLTPQPSIADRIVPFKPTPPRSGASINNTNPNINPTPIRGLGVGKNALTDQTNPNAMGKYASNIQKSDIEDAMAMGTHAAQNNIEAAEGASKNVVKFTDLKLLNQFVSDNEQKVQLISTDSDGNFYAHLKGK